MFCILKGVTKCKCKCCASPHTTTGGAIERDPSECYYIVLEHFLEPHTREEDVFELDGSQSDFNVDTGHT